MRDFICACIIVLLGLFPTGIHTFRRSAYTQHTIVVESRSFQRDQRSVDNTRTNSSAKGASSIAKLEEERNQSIVGNISTNSSANESGTELGGDFKASSFVKLEENFTAGHLLILVLIFVILFPSCVFLFLWLAADCCRVSSRYRRNSAGRTTTRKALTTTDADSATERSDLEWCHHSAIDVSGRLSSDIEIIPPTWNAESLKEVLHVQNLNIRGGETPKGARSTSGSRFFGGVDEPMWTQEQLEHFASELSKGKARLARQDKSLLRVVDMVIVFVTYERDSLVLQELAHPSYKNVLKEEAYISECTLKSRLQSNEDFMKCAERCLRKLGAGMDRLIEIVPDIIGMREERRILQSSHPGLTTLMQYYVVEARVVTETEHDLVALGLRSQTLNVDGYVYKWEHLENVAYAQRHLKWAWGSSRQGAVKWLGVTHSFLPVLPWTKNAVFEKLQERGISAQHSPPPDAMKDLLRSLNEGCVSLAVRTGSPPKLVCVEEMVSVVVTSPRKAMVLLSGFQEGDLPILPSVQQHASESPWRAAVRLSQTILGLSAPLFQMDCRVLATSDEAEDQKNWEHVKRVRIVRGPLIDCGVVRR